MDNVADSVRANIFLSYRLTVREKEILYYVATGEADKKIADRLNLSVRTINNHVDNALVKLDAANRANAVAKAILLGLIQPRLADVVTGRVVASEMLIRTPKAVDVRYCEGRYIVQKNAL